jgi:hypothetical protein
LKEWIEYHRLLGFDHFFIADDCSFDNKTISLLRRYEKKGFITASVEQEFNNCSYHVPNENKLISLMFRNAQPKCEWIAHFDVDEYISTDAPYSSLSLKNYLQSGGSYALRLVWYIMGSDGIEKRVQNKLTIETYKNGKVTKSMCFIKTIARSNSVIDWNHSHMPIFNGSLPKVNIFKNAICQAYDFKDQTLSIGSEECIIPAKKFFLKHYLPRSWEEFIADRGSRKKTSDDQPNQWADQPRVKWESQWFNSSCSLGDSFTHQMAILTRKRLAEILYGRHLLVSSFF